ncbi:MAG TPA: branched-chain amino acid transaminase [Bacteroidota bacterium]|nr:branched-chain amino acid transaminase [Bacteroidota bacterium]
MPIEKVDKIWMNGKFVDWDDAKIHVLSHVVHYGTSWFEGLRCYDTKKGSAVFQLEAHIRRLIDSAKIYRTELPYSLEQLSEAALETIRINKVKECYVRPVAYRGYGDMGVNPLGCPVDVAIAIWRWGAYLGAEALEAGIDVCTSTWHRPMPGTFPSMAKAGGNYLNSQLIKLEALANGYEEGIALSAMGTVSEGSGENVFVVRDGIIYTAPYSSALLPGITRSSILTIAKKLGFTVIETEIPREMLYIADEVFFAGTAAELTPIRSVDKIVVGKGMAGEVTKALQKAFFDVVRNANDPYHWLTFV